MTPLLRGDAFRIPLRSGSVDLVIFSPPYFQQRSYRDGEEVLVGQIGAEPSPDDYLQALWVVMRELWRVLKPGGSIFVNLGDKRSQRIVVRDSTHRHPVGEDVVGRHPGAAAGGQVLPRTAERGELVGSVTEHAGLAREKSKMLLPHRFAQGCQDGLADPCVKDHDHVGRHPAYLESEQCRGMGWVVRQDVVWEKTAGMPESVTDRTRDSHEYVFHLTKSTRYYAAVDEVRSPYSDDRPLSPAPTQAGVPNRGTNSGMTGKNLGVLGGNPLGGLPSSVWTLNPEPLVIPEAARIKYDLPSHFAAFPTELPRRLVLGWSPPGICTACGEGRRPVVAKGEPRPVRGTLLAEPEIVTENTGRAVTIHDGKTNMVRTNLGWSFLTRDSRVLGYACACTPRTSHRGKRGDWKEGRTEQVDTLSDDWHRAGASAPRRLTPNGQGVKILPPPDTPMWEYHFDGWEAPPTRQAVVFDPFVGTGTTVGVAQALGRVGIGMDLSAAYLRLARWRVEHSGHFDKVVARRDAERTVGSGDPSLEHRSGQGVLL